jgi:hypothetical protein
MMMDAHAAGGIFDRRFIESGRLRKEGPVLCRLISQRVGCC